MSHQSFPIQLTPELAELLERRSELMNGNSNDDSQAWLNEMEIVNRTIAIFTDIAYGKAKSQGLIQ